MVNACWLTSWLRNPYDCSALRPAEASLPSASVAAGLEAERCSTSWAWCRVARLSHSVVAIEVANAPAVMRMKLLRPDAEAIWSCLSPDRARVTSGMKKHDTAAPWMRVGMITVRTSTCEVKLPRIAATTAKMSSAAVAKIRVDLARGPVDQRREEQGEQPHRGERPA